jgi:hypothetical protein
LQHHLLLLLLLLLSGLLLLRLLLLRGVHLPIVPAVVLCLAVVQ